MYSFSYLEPVCFSMSSSNCCFLTCIQISRGRPGGLVFPSFSEFSTVYCAVKTSVITIYKIHQFSSVAQSCPTLCDPMDCSTPGFPVHHQLPELAQTHVHLNRWCRPTISSSIILFSSCLQSFSASLSFPMSQFFAQGGQNIGVSVSTSVLPMNTQDWSPLDGLVGFPCSPRISQESSPTAQFKSINSSGLSFLYSPTRTSIHDHWKNHSLD